MDFTTVKRDAEPGEHIVITNADIHNLNESGIHNGDIFKVDKVYDNDQGFGIWRAALVNFGRLRDFEIYGNEYEVLIQVEECVDDESYDPESVLSWNNDRLTHEVIELQYRLSELERLIPQ